MTGVLESKLMFTFYFAMEFEVGSLFPKLNGLSLLNYKKSLLQTQVRKIYKKRILPMILSG